MDITKTLYVTAREDWRQWLAENYKTAREIWLVYPNKATNKPRITYNAAVEEALCFGWIDSTMKKLDEDSTAQRFTPRNPKSSYSQPNIERLNKLAKENKLRPEVAEAVKKIINRPFIFPEDIINEIRANKVAWQNYQKFSPVYRRLRIAFIEGARNRPEEFQKRLKNFIKKTEQNKMFGFGGINEYY